MSDQPPAPKPAKAPPPKPDKPKAPPPQAARVKETGGPEGPEPTRYGDWERKGRVSDF